MSKKPKQKLQPAAATPATPKGQYAPQHRKDIFSVRNLCLMLALISFVLYANTLVNGYVMDDVIVLKENAIVAKGFKAIPELFTTPHMYGYMVIPNDMYRPLSMVMFAIEYGLFGLNPAVNHFFNIAVFIGCVIMLFLFLRCFFGEQRVVLAFIGALIFAIHPLHTEVVANIKSRDELLCFFFAFWSLVLFAGYMRKGHMLSLAGGLFTLFLSYLSKETVVTFLAIIPILFFVYINNDRKRAIVITVGTVAVTALFLIIRAHILGAYHANQPTPVDFVDNALAKSGGIERFATEVVIMGRYLWLQFVPYPLLSTYSFNAIPFASLGSISFWLSLLAYSLLVYVAITRPMKNSKDPWTFAILFFIITLSLFSNFPFLMGAEMAERFAFFASAGFCIAVALGIEKWVIKAAATDKSVLKSGKVLAILLPLLLVYGSMTMARNTDWKDNFTLYKADLEKSPENSRLYHYIGTALAEEEYLKDTDSLERKQMDAEATGYLKKAVEIYPDYAEAHVELGRIYDRERMYDSAIAEDKRALASNPAHAMANNNLGSVYLTTGNYPEAVLYFRRALQINPGLQITNVNLARTYNQMNQVDSAVHYFNIVAQYSEAYALEAYEQTGAMYFFQQKYDLSEAALKKAIAIKPDDVNALNTLGAIYLNTKKYNDAIAAFNKVLAHNPGYITAVSNLGRAYYLNNQFTESLVAFNKELALDPKSGRDIPYMAMAYQKTGNMEMAHKYEAIARQIYSNFRLQ